MSGSLLTTTGRWSKFNMMFPQDQGATMNPSNLPDGYRPRPSDVCCGRGKKNWNHEGNTLFRQLIRNNVKPYQEAPDKHEKAAIVNSIVDAIREQGGRFIKQTDDKRWYDIGETQAKEKVSHSLRDQVNAQLKAQQQQQQHQQDDDELAPQPVASPRKREDPDVGDASSAAKKPRTSQPLHRSSSLPANADANIPLDQQLVPPFVAVRHPSLEFPYSSAFASSALPTTTTRAFLDPTHQTSLQQPPSPPGGLAAPAASFTNLSLGPGDQTPNRSLQQDPTLEQARLQIPNFSLPLDASIEPRPFAPAPAEDQKKEPDHQEGKEDSKPPPNPHPMFPPHEPPFS